MSDNDFFKKYYDILYSACKRAFEELFNANKEKFYYCTLTITGDGLTPVISAWSYEALCRQCNGNQDEMNDIKWSYADSPYYAVGYEMFDSVTELLIERHNIIKIDEIADQDWVHEVDMYLNVMYNVMKMLDMDGMFSKTQKREDVLIAVEIMPPDDSCTTLIKKLNSNNTEIFKEWKQEISE